ncbi:MAG TPA: hypothetical protein DCR93_28315 [Cytophagales bacterium]|nr:hypothetical protein [Cytophagales bacterium]HAP63239.1 hypothetical protein [Cytophagales bacterium]
MGLQHTKKVHVAIKKQSPYIIPMQVTFSDSFIASKGHPRTKLYQELISQLEGVFAGENNLIANLANLTALLKNAFDFHWVGFFLVEGDELIVGPFQGNISMTRVKKGKGLLGEAFANGKSRVVPDLNHLLGTIKIDDREGSSIIIPGKVKDSVLVVLDVTSADTNFFDEIDREALEKIVNVVLHASDLSAYFPNDMVLSLALSHGGWNSTLSIEEEVAQIRNSRNFHRDVESF